MAGKRIFNSSWESAMKPPKKGEVKKLFVSYEDIEQGVKKGGAFAGAHRKRR